MTVSKLLNTSFSTSPLKELDKEVEKPPSTVEKLNAKVKPLQTHVHKQDLAVVKKKSPELNKKDIKPVSRSVLCGPYSWHQHMLGLPFQG